MKYINKDITTVEHGIMIKLHLSVILVLILAGCQSPEEKEREFYRLPAYDSACTEACSMFQRGLRDYPDYCGPDCSVYEKDDSSELEKDQ